jgi:hypothetical protein
MSAEIQGQLFVGHREGGAHACGHFRFRIIAGYTGLLLKRSEPVADKPIRQQTEVDAELESFVGEQRQSLRYSPPGRKPAGGRLEDQPGSAHAPPPARSSDEPGLSSSEWIP